MEPLGQLARPVTLAELKADPAFEEGELRAVVDSTFPLEQVAEAHRHMEANRNFGKVVLRIP